jgi:hypothetical protein
MKLREMINLFKARRGAMEIEEIVKLVIAIAILIILVSGVIFLLSGKGGEILTSVRQALRLGR